ncbi:MAG: diguanylate cyclase [Proteobacteria bacterium]|nr:diguanylate cyclase [Pseudomonadota bacterium]MBU1233548.1 diguanylate cyclase [Pseudomonadota bacterium]MBU1418030.1 diguanylate cyclase [Pseudomonadota bacterium]MBU1455919.1 diguanylate cyclase [Pseudomonadota bacterium]
MKNRDVFRILFLSMILFGLLMGVAFPPLVKLYFNDTTSISISFTLMCIAAGITVGIANYILFSIFISKELSYLVEGMNRVNNHISAALFSRHIQTGAFEIEVKSNDMIGQVTMAFNTMGRTVEQRLLNETRFRNLISDLSANVALDKTAEIILKYFIEATCMTSGLIYGKVEEEMTLLSSKGFDTDEKLPRKLESWQGPIADAIQSGEPYTIDTESNCIDWMTTTTPYGCIKPKLIRIIPLIAEKSTVGLVIAACGQSEVPESIQMETLKTYSSYMAPYLQNALLHNKIQEMASYDFLTHVLNRRFGLVRLQEEFSTALRHRSDLSVIMIDIDKFKTINDTHGHEAGDQVLKTVTSSLSLHLRNEEIICRYGGEEFLIILPMTNLNKAGLVAERLRDLVEQQTFYYKDKVILVTISLGVSSLSSLVTQNENDLINSADTALYHTKKMGRNQVAIFRNNEAVLLPRNKPTLA